MYYYVIDFSFAVCHFFFFFFFFFFFLFVPHISVIVKRSELPKALHKFLFLILLDQGEAQIKRQSPIHCPWRSTNHTAKSDALSMAGHKSHRARDKSHGKADGGAQITRQSLMHCSWRGTNHTAKPDAPSMAGHKSHGKA